jgi:hypothetical protein
MRAPQLLVAAFPSGFVKHPSVPFWLWIDFPAPRSLGYPAGSDSPAIRWSILANNRFVRWLSANNSQ